MFKPDNSCVLCHYCALPRDAISVRLPTVSCHHIHSCMSFLLQLFHHVVAGEHGCWIQPVASPSTLQAVSTLLSELDLTVILPRMDGQHEVRSELTRLDLLPAFHVYNAELHLTTLSPLAAIRVSTLPKVMAHIKVTSARGGFRAEFSALISPDVTSSG